jgi:hypothetical protein
MTTFYTHRWFRVSLAIVTALMIGILVCCWQYKIWSIDDGLAYYGMNRECHPVWRELYWGRIREGQAIEEVIALTNPTTVYRFDDYVDLFYEKHPTSDGLPFVGLTIIAHEGCLVVAQAHGCTWRHKFFGNWSDNDWDTYTKQYRASRKMRFNQPELK